MATTPFFTIITATYNAAETLSCLLDSLATQTYRDFELIIQDGGSKDETLALAEAYRAKLPALSVASEPDTGIYDAWNKALLGVRGEWLLFLGADDRLADIAILSRVAVKLLDAPSGVQFALGHLAQIFEDTSLKEVTIRDVKDVPQLLRNEMPLPFPALFIRAALCREVRFDSSLSIAADYDFLCRVWNSNNQSINLDFTVVTMLASGVSNLPHFRLKAIQEERTIQRRYFQSTQSIKRTWLITKAYVLHLIVLVAGRNYAPRILNLLRKWRGLPPRWDESTQKNGNR